MPEKTSTASGLTLGTMEGLRSYVPERGWEDVVQERKENSDEKSTEDDFFEGEYEPTLTEQITSSEQKQELEEDFIEHDLADISNDDSINSLARKVAKTNSLVDSALSDDGKFTRNSSVEATKQLDQLGASLSELFSDLYEEKSQNTRSPWETVSEAFDELSSEVKKREDLRSQLTSTQEKIDSCRQELVKTIERLTDDEQERLSAIKMRSRLATVMADKLLRKLK